MTMALSRIVRTVSGASVAALLLAAGVAHSTGTRQVEGPALKAPTAAEEVFSDAPYGVDPVVTGPTSASFRSKQAENGCDKAVWPDIPVACYPGR